jgi:hypothetical protein
MLLFVFLCCHLLRVRVHNTKTSECNKHTEKGCLVCCCFCHTQRRGAKANRITEKFSFSEKRWACALVWTPDNVCVHVNSNGIYVQLQRGRKKNRPKDGRNTKISFQHSNHSTTRERKKKNGPHTTTRKKCSIVCLVVWCCDTEKRRCYNTGGTTLE